MAKDLEATCGGGGVLVWLVKARVEDTRRLLQGKHMFLRGEIPLDHRLCVWWIR